MNDATMVLMVPVHWFRAGVTRFGKAEGVYENPETGELKRIHALLVRGVYPNPDHWKVQYGDEGGSWRDVGDLPMESAVMVSEYWMGYNKHKVSTGRHYKE